MVQVHCEHCNKEVDVVMYYYDTHIVTHEYMYTTDYEAVVQGKAMCPSCGAEVKKTFHRFITPKDIIKFATTHSRATEVPCESD